MRVAHGAIRGKRREESIDRLRFGLSGLVVGTHTLFQEAVLLPKLALVVIDEQHRFGVEQRRALTSKGDHVHQLMMSATPIPRTLAMSFYAHLEVCVLSEKPPGRTAVRTSSCSNERRYEALTRLAEHVARGGRAYWVCPLIDKDEEAGLLDVQTLAEEVSIRHPTMKVGILHGRRNRRRSVL